MFHRQVVHLSSALQLLMLVLLQQEPQLEAALLIARPFPESAETVRECEHVHSCYQQLFTCFACWQAAPSPDLTRDWLCCCCAMLLLLCCASSARPDPPCTAATCEVTIELSRKCLWNGTAAKRFIHLPLPTVTIMISCCRPHCPPAHSIEADMRRITDFTML